MAKTLLQKFARKCYTSQHLRPQEYGVWEVCMRLTSGGKNKLYFDGRNMAARFTGISKSSIYRIVEALVASGWLLPLNGQGKKVDKSTMQYKATEYQVLTHEQWTAKHSTKGCASEDDSPVPSTGTGPVPRAETASPTGGNGQSQNNQSPVPRAGHSSVTPSSMKESSMSNSPVVAPPSALLNKNRKAGEECVSMPSVAASPAGGNGRVSASPTGGNGHVPEPTLAELHQKLTLDNQKLWYRRTGGASGAEGIRVAAEILATQGAM